MYFLAKLCVRPKNYLRSNLFLQNFSLSNLSINSLTALVNGAASVYPSGSSLLTTRGSCPTAGEFNCIHDWNARFRTSEQVLFKVFFRLASSSASFTEDQEGSWVAPTCKLSGSNATFAYMTTQLSRLQWTPERPCSPFTLSSRA